jgi:hypothetical protein
MDVASKNNTQSLENVIGIKDAYYKTNILVNGKWSTFMYLKYAFLVRNNFVFYVWFMNFLVLKDSIQLRKSFL